MGKNLYVDSLKLCSTEANIDIFSFPQINFSQYFLYLRKISKNSFQYTAFKFFYLKDAYKIKNNNKIKLNLLVFEPEFE